MPAGPRTAIMASMTLPLITRLVLVPVPPPDRGGASPRRFRIARLDVNPGDAGAGERHAHLKRVYD